MALGQVFKSDYNMRTFLQNIVTPPPLATNNYLYKSRYNLAYRMSLFLLIALLLLTISLFIFFSPEMGITTLVVDLCVAGALFYIRKSGNYYIPVLSYNIAGAIGCVLVLFLIEQQAHFVNPLWMIVNILFSFSVLDRKWGIIFTIIHGIATSLFFGLYYDREIIIASQLSEAQLASTSVNLLICFSIIGFLGWQNITTNATAKVRLEEAQKALQDQYDIISKQNEEKTVMLKEIHHRVKNNLQIITSLLRLQSRELENPEAIAKFKDATHRVIAMSMIHEKMYQSDQLSTLHLNEYLKDLSNDLVSSYQAGYPVKLDINCTVKNIGLKSVVPIALILNELISNTLKYAFDDEDNCQININFEPFNDKQCRLVYSDSGSWKTPSRQGSFGLDLIESLTSQLEGSMKLETYPDTTFEFLFIPTED